MAQNGSFLSQNTPPFPNGGEGGYFSVIFSVLTFMGANGGLLWPKLPVFVSKLGTFRDQIPNRGRGALN